MYEELLSTKEDGRIKLFTIYRVLKARKSYREVFESGDYIPLKGVGSFHRSVFAFAKMKEKHGAVVIVPRFLSSLVKGGLEGQGRGSAGRRRYPVGRPAARDVAFLHAAVVRNIGGSEWSLRQNRIHRSPRHLPAYRPKNHGHAQFRLRSKDGDQKGERDTNQRRAIVMKRLSYMKSGTY